MCNASAAKNKHHKETRKPDQVAAEHINVSQMLKYLVLFYVSCCQINLFVVFMACNAVLNYDLCANVM